MKPVSEKAKQVISFLQQMKQTPKQETAPDYAQRRAYVEQRHAQAPTAEGISFQEELLGGVLTECSTPEAPRNDTIVLYVHGGGFSTGSAKTSRAYASALARAAQTRVHSVSYRLAPEDSFPAASNDCLAVYTALLEKYPAANIVLVGGSAGANLCLVIAHRAKEAAIAMPAALALFSPVADLTGTLESRVRNAKSDCMISPEIDREIKTIYTAGQDVKHPHISPVYGDFTDFPPIKLVVDAGEVLLDDSLLVATQAAKAGCAVDLQVWQGLFHDFPSTGAGMLESEEVMNDTVAFLTRHCFGPNQ